MCGQISRQSSTSLACTLLTFREHGLWWQPCTMSTLPICMCPNQTRISRLSSLCLASRMCSHMFLDSRGSRVGLCKYTLQYMLEMYILNVFVNITAKLQTNRSLTYTKLRDCVEFTSLRRSPKVYQAQRSSVLLDLRTWDHLSLLTTEPHGTRFEHRLLTTRDSS